MIVATAPPLPSSLEEEAELIASLEAEFLEEEAKLVASIEAEFFEEPLVGEPFLSDEELAKIRNWRRP